MSSPVAVYQITATLREQEIEDPGPPIDAPVRVPTLDEVNRAIEVVFEDLGFDVRVTSERKDI